MYYWTIEWSITHYFNYDVGHVKVVDNLIKSGANVNTMDNDGYTPLLIAAKKGNWTNNFNKRLFFIKLNHFCDLGHEKVVALLLDNGANINVADKDGRSPLFVAAIIGNMKKKKILKKWSYFISTKQLRYLGNEKIIESLIKNDANINAPNANGSTPLYAAASNGRFKQIVIVCNIHQFKL